MNISGEKYRTIIRRILSIAGVAAAGTGLATIANSQVFAHQILQDMGTAPNVEMVYSPELQIMVKPGTTEPVYSSANPASFKVAGTSAVTQGPGPNGKGPHADPD